MNTVFGVPRPIWEIITGLNRCRFDLSNEKAAQEQIASTLQGLEPSVIREHRLSRRDILDFFCPHIGLAIEVKLRTSTKMEVYRQLQRYARSPDVQALLLLTNLSMGLPTTIEEKPAYYASLGRAWL